MPLPLLFFLLCILLLYCYLIRHHNYWRKRNVPYPKPSLLFGNWQNVALLKTTVGECLQKIYNEYEGHPFIGMYDMLGVPIVLVRDPKLIKCILVKNFTYFQGRGIRIKENVDPLSATLVALSGQRWRILRTKLTSAFTSNKIRHVFELFANVSEKFKQFVQQYADKEEPIEFRDLTEKFNLEVIATCFFGLEINAIQKDDSEFHTMFKRVLGPSLAMTVKRIIRDYMSEVFRWLPIPFSPSDIGKYFMQVVKDVITHRQTNNITRNDIMQLLMELRYKETQENHTSAQSQDIVIDDKTIAAQAYVFLLAGVDTSAITMSFAMYELAANPKIQKKLYDEIQTVCEKHDCFSYDALSEMEYLDRIVNETLRKYPPISMTVRLCEESYKIPDSNVVIEKGTKVLVPIRAIHYDPLYYKDPDIFNPDRFLDESKKLRDNHTFLAFGDGPRICIGMRFAYVQIKAGIVALIANYEVELSEKISIPLEFDPTAFSLTSKSGIWLRIRRRLQDVTRKES